MKNRFTEFIMNVIILLIIGTLIFLGINFYKNYMQVGNVEEPENFQTVIQDNEVEIADNTAIPQYIEENPFNEIKDNSENITTIDENSMSSYKYFYKQLNENSKKFYKGFYDNIYNMKTGMYKVNFGNLFYDTLSKEGGDEVLIQEYQSAIEAFTYDNPEAFFLDPNKMYINIETKTKLYKKEYNVYVDNGDSSSYLTDEFASKSKVDEAIESVREVRDNLIAKKTQNDYKNIKMVHDYLVNNIEYDETLSKKNIYNIYGALSNNLSVCEGYAKAFKYIMDGMNIPTIIVIGEGVNSTGEREKHSWNYVKLNDKWYALDVTWDDPIVRGGGVLSEKAKYRYFLKGKNTFDKDHKEERTFTENGKVFEYPVLNVKDY